ncbi:hypothetical protein [Acidiphilium sp.]|nr:hypothetical protein [Acidiphilium sp.]
MTVHRSNQPHDPTRTLDGTLRPLFERWYPGLANDNGDEPAQAAA